MDVLLSENEEMIRNLAREFLEGECPTSLVRDMEKDELGYSQDMCKKLAAELGWTALSLPEQSFPQALRGSSLKVQLDLPDPLID